MGEVERAQALLQAAGVSGVKVQEQAEMVTMSRAEADALRAGAAPAAPAETPGQEYARQQQAAAQAGTPPGGEFTLAEYDRMSRVEQKAFALTDEGDAAITAALRREG